MGSQGSTEVPHSEQKELFFKKVDVNWGKGPDLKVDQALQRFCGPNSLENLRNHWQTTREKVGRQQADSCVDQHGPDWLKSLVEKLSSTAPVPEVAGLMALVAAIFIDVRTYSPTPNTKDVLRQLFAEEKANAVWDQVDECIKRCIMHFDNCEKLGPELERVEVQLSKTLTTLKNSMLRDGHMTNGALRGWINGAAVHVQILVQLLRLRPRQSPNTIQNLLDIYDRDLTLLFQDHKQLMSQKFKVRCQLDGSRWSPDYEPNSELHFTNEDQRTIIMPHNDYNYINANGFTLYYEYRYGQQETLISQYFSNVRKNL